MLLDPFDKHFNPNGDSFFLLRGSLVDEPKVGMSLIKLFTYSKFYSTQGNLLMINL